MYDVKHLHGGCMWSTTARGRRRRCCLYTDRGPRVALGARWCRHSPASITSSGLTFRATASPRPRRGTTCLSRRGARGCAAQRPRASSRHRGRALQRRLHRHRTRGTVSRPGGFARTDQQRPESQRAASPAGPPSGPDGPAVRPAPVVGAVGRDDPQGDGPASGPSWASHPSELPSWCASTTRPTFWRRVTPPPALPRRAATSTSPTFTARSRRSPGSRPRPWPPRRGSRSTTSRGLPHREPDAADSWRIPPADLRRTACVRRHGGFHTQRRT